MVLRIYFLSILFPVFLVAASFNSKEEEDVLFDLTSKVYKLVVEHGSEGVLQSELWKELVLTSRDGSRLAIRLERRGMIRREKVLDGGRWTYKLTPLRMPVQIRSIEEAPCLTCPYEAKCSLTGVVSPLSCPWISEWVVKEFRELVSPVEISAAPMKRIATAAIR
jgi:DNA-binding MarR family transcriptional regulator